MDDRLFCLKRGTSVDSLAFGETTEVIMRLILLAVASAALWKFWQESMEREREGLIGTAR
jgi:hypothetical protein